MKKFLAFAIMALSLILTTPAWAQQSLTLKKIDELLSQGELLAFKTYLKHQPKLKQGKMRAYNALSDIRICHKKFKFQPYNVCHLLAKPTTLSAGVSMGVEMWNSLASIAKTDTLQASTAALLMVEWANSVGIHRHEYTAIRIENEIYKQIKACLKSKPANQCLRLNHEQSVALNHSIVFLLGTEEGQRSAIKLSDIYFQSVMIMQVEKIKKQ